MRLGCQRSWEPTMTGKMGYRLGLGTYSELTSQRLGLVLMFYCLLWTFSSTDAAVQVCTLPCSSYRLRVMDMLSPPACTGLSRTLL